MRHQAETVIDLGEFGQRAVLVDYSYRPGSPAQRLAEPPAEEEELDVHAVAQSNGTTAASWPQLAALAESLGVRLEDMLHDRLAQAAAEQRRAAAERLVEMRAGAALCGEG